MKTTGKICALILLVILGSSFAASLVSPYDPDEIDLDHLRQPPSFSHPLGTDNKGRDIFARVLHGGRVSVSVAVAAAVVSMSVGLLVGLISGFAGGKLDTLLMALVDLVLSFPSLLLAIGISILFPPGVYSVMIALSAVGWAGFARLIRGNVLVLRDSLFIDAARVSGCSSSRILFVHVLPQCIPVALVMMGMKLGGYILTEAALSFLGLGAQPPTATWGSMISTSRSYIHAAPWMVFSPGIMIAVTTLCFNLLGDSLREKFMMQDSGMRQTV